MFLTIVTMWMHFQQSSTHLWKALERLSLVMVLSTPSQVFFKLCWAFKVPARTVLIKN